MNIDGSKYRILASVCGTCKFPYLTAKDEAGVNLPCPICERNAEIDRLRASLADREPMVDALRALLDKYAVHVQTVVTPSERYADDGGYADDGVREACVCGCPWSAHADTGQCSGGIGVDGRTLCPCRQYTPEIP